MQFLEEEVNRVIIFSSAEQTIENLIVDTGTLEVFFNYISSNEHLQKKQAAAIMLMRYIKDYWVRISSNDNLSYS
jgi:hypothetical protein